MLQAEPGGRHSGRAWERPRECPQVGSDRGSQGPVPGAAGVQHCLLPRALLSICWRGAELGGRRRNDTLAPAFHTLSQPQIKPGAGPDLTAPIPMLFPHLISSIEKWVSAPFFIFIFISTSLV